MILTGYFCLLSTVVLVLRTQCCRRIPGVRNLDLGRFAGVWYDVERTPDPFADTLRCVRTTYSFEAGPKIIKEGVTRRGRPVAFEAEATFLNQSRNRAIIKIVPPEGGPEVLYKVVRTNYVEYAVVVACMQHSGSPTRWAWIQSRRPILHSDTREVLRRVLHAFAFDRDTVIPQRFDDCAAQYNSTSGT